MRQNTTKANISVSPPPLSLSLSLQVLVRKFSRATETLEEVPQEDVERVALAVSRHEFDARLAPYPFSQCKHWPKLASHISGQVRVLLC